MTSNEESGTENTIYYFLLYTNCPRRYAIKINDVFLLQGYENYKQREVIQQKKPKIIVLYPWIRKV
jgi:hypothetical protein